MPKQKGGKKNQSEYVEKLAGKAVTPIIERYGYKLWDVVYEKEGAMWYLKVLFDKPDGSISDDECEEITAPINEAIDALPCIDLIDVLEAGSSGLDRPLRTARHFEELCGERIRAAVKTPDGKTEYISGRLTGYDEQTGDFTLLSDSGEHKLNTAKCKRINLDGLYEDTDEEQ